MNIKNITGLQIFDSRGNPTVKAYVELENGVVGTAMVPSGASTGSYEAHELRDLDMKSYEGKGVSRAVNNVNTVIADGLRGMSIDDLTAIDAKLLELDGTENKSNLGANALLAVSLAATRAHALAHNKPLWKTINEYYFDSMKPAFPRLMVNIINGGAHAGWNLDFQEFMILPKETQPSKSTKIASEVFHALKKILSSRKLSVGVGDEGGFAPMLNSNEEGFQLLWEAAKAAGYSEDDLNLGSDFAASEFYKGTSYELAKDQKTFSSEELAEYYAEMVKKYHVLSLEDPFSEDDWVSFQALTSLIGADHTIIGDDLYVTNVKRIQEGITRKASNGVLIKVNQIGTVSETVAAIKLTREAGWKIAISHRSGETEDSFIADLAYACGADFIKTGSMSRSERLAKYNRLIEIEQREI